MAAKFATGWGTALRSDLGTSATSLPLRSTDAARLCAILGPDDHTFLVLNNGVDVEIVEATCSGGSVLIDRGSSPIAVPAGGCVTFEVTEQLLADYVIPNNAVCEIKGEGGITATQEGCEVTLTLGEDCEAVTWRSGNTEYVFENGCVTATPALGGCSLVPGMYRNATITVNEHGQICTIETGSNIVFKDTPCCNCTQEE